MTKSVKINPLIIIRYDDNYCIYVTEAPNQQTADQIQEKLNKIIDLVQDSGRIDVDRVYTLGRLLYLVKRPTVGNDIDEFLETSRALHELENFEDVFGLASRTRWLLIMFPLSQPNKIRTCPFCLEHDTLVYSDIDLGGKLFTCSVCGHSFIIRYEAVCIEEGSEKYIIER